ncbi:hypothetical protein C5C31_13450 [Rathayibacter rathayi]|uniref:Siderophore-interacting FAD-binding domain-containing protein n=1 Tax=Rathayibacter rathayi TaxID=33887 RepID=A0ABD6W658_RATRA|nr:siderophore-interacting protein [Rathayibacter rathayi]AZZ50274.1 hypothetical protein C1O28_14620 [Rathayibacter rathayi]MWV74427.1 hypothetical protein [Rathayibacter rathayi NCPPB 2980 = VKM Ac-1601]PPF10764.1 hypothetical protein C5C04_13035 [Rathayibacter rathayi]PPF22848.1 hypothetical protein C5C34_11095 [Rathayibacter rathayi]PPF43754.1 hypothetical protein C5C08_13900 [Rathayibacter rathayi]
MTDAVPSPDRPRRARSQHLLTVLRTERLAAADRDVKLLLPPRGSDLPPPFDLDALRASVAPEQLPVRRTSTVRSVAVDLVVHGDEGVAGGLWAGPKTASRPRSASRSV